MTEKKKTDRHGGSRAVQRETDARTIEGRRKLELLADPETRANVERWAKLGISKASIAAKLDISVRIFDQHFGPDFLRARFDSVLVMRAKLYNIALKAKGHGAVLAWLRSMGDVTDKVTLTDQDGDPIKLVDLSPILEKMNRDELSIAERIIDELISAGGGNIPRVLN